MVIFGFIAFLWTTLLITFVLCFFKHMDKPKTNCLIDEMDEFIKEMNDKGEQL